MEALTDLRKRLERAVVALSSKTTVPIGATELLLAAGLDPDPTPCDTLREIAHDLEHLEDSLWGIEPLRGGSA